MAANETVETNEVKVSGNMAPTREYDRMSNAVCLLKPGSNATGKNWKATGFYVKIEISSDKKRVLHCIMTNHHVFRESENAEEMVAVFNYTADNENPAEVVLRPTEIHALCKELDYALVRVDRERMKSLKIDPIDTDNPYYPKVLDIVHIIQHPEGREKHFSADKITNIAPPFIHYYADTLLGSSGSPVITVVRDKCVLVALHCKGVMSTPLDQPYNKGVLISEIISNLRTGKYTKSSPNPMPAVPAMLESGFEVPTDTTSGANPMPAASATMESGCHVPTGSKNPHLLVTDEDIRNIPSDIVKVWRQLARALSLSENIVDSINIDYDTAYEKSYQMLRKWKQIKVSKANYETLATAFRDLAVGRGDLIPKFC